MAHRVLVTDTLPEEGLALLREDSNIELVIDTSLAKNPPALKAALAEADGIVIRSDTKLTAEVLQGQERLKVIVRAGVGVDNINVPAASRQGIVVMNTPGGNTISTAEHAIALILALSRNIPQACTSLKNGKWDRKKLTGAQLGGKTLGIIGLGRIGVAVAKRAQGFEMKTIGFDPFMTAERAQELGIESVSRLDDLWGRCDYITLHTPYSSETHHLVNQKAFDSMRTGVRIINCARGGLIDEDALIRALDNGKVAGAAIDVFEQEPPPADLPIVVHPKTLVTPHLGASTEEAQLSVAIEAARLLVDYFGKGQVRFSVNMSSLDKAELEELRHYLDMGRRLGMLHSQMDRGSAKSVELAYSGDVASKNTHLITSAFAAGWMESAMDDQVNLVNAAILAQERGIRITETKSKESHDFGSLVQASVQTEQKTYTASSALFGRQRIRLVGLGPYQLDANLAGNLFVFTHLDRPGLIGFIGHTMGKHGVNIAQMNVGREQAGGEAIGVLNLDSIPPDSALDEIRAHPDVISVRLIKLPEAGATPPWL